MDYLKILVASLLSAVVLFILAKLMGNKQISQLNTFDYITGITIGSIAAEMATDLENHLFQNILSMVVYAAIAIAISAATSHSLWARKFFAGRPLILLEKGKLYKKHLKEAKLDLHEFLGMARLAGFFDLSQLEAAIFEHNGNISFLPKAQFRPASPQDLIQEPSSMPPRETLFSDLIVDGNIMDGNLKKAGKDRVWLQKQLEDNGYKKASEVFLLLADQENNTVIFGME